MKKETLDKAIRLGLTTQVELKAFELGYMQGKSDTYDEVLNEVRGTTKDEPLELYDPLNDDIETIPGYMNRAIASFVEKEGCRERGV